MRRFPFSFALVTVPPEGASLPNNPPPHDRNGALPPRIDGELPFTLEGLDAEGSFLALSG